MIKDRFPNINKGLQGIKVFLIIQYINTTILSAESAWWESVYVKRLSFTIC